MADKSAKLENIMLGLNWIDYIILTLLIFYVLKGYYVGFLKASLDLASFVFSFIIGLKFYGVIGGILIKQLSFPVGFADAIGFFIAAFASEIILGVILRNIFNIHLNRFRKLNRILGILPSILSGMILFAFLLTLVIALPVSPFIKQAIFSSRMGKILTSNTVGLEKNLNNIFGGAVSETISFMTVKPNSNEILSLNFQTTTVKIDEGEEDYMLSLVNKQREKAGIGVLVMDEKLKEVARNHCRDMFAKGYFSHYTREGLSAFDRMEKAGILYREAGENLALSPNADLAMQGLMESPGHKANILALTFGKVGIGAIDGGIYGKMFCQEFTD